MVLADELSMGMTGSSHGVGNVGGASVDPGWSDSLLFGAATGENSLANSNQSCICSCNGCGSTSMVVAGISMIV